MTLRRKKGEDQLVYSARLFAERKKKEKERKEMSINLNKTVSSVESGMEESIPAESEKNFLEDLLSLIPMYEGIKNDFKDLKDEFKKYDENKNGILEADEAMNAIVNSQKIKPKLLSIAGGIFSLITFIIGLIGKEINWVLLFGSILVTALCIAIYYYTRNTNAGIIKTTSRIALEVRAKQQEHEEYKKEKRQQVKDLYTRIDGLQETKYQLMADNNYKSNLLNEMQKKINELKK
jgi:uncharacterized protein (UPF0333 family)